MGMRDYAINDYGLLMPRDVIKTVASKYCNDYTEEDYEIDEWGFNEELYNAGLVEYIGEFYGEAIHIDDNGVDDYSRREDSYRGDTMFYIPVMKMSTLFNSAYKDINELIDEFKEKISEYLTEDFDYRNYIRHIVGTYYG